MSRFIPRYFEEAHISINALLQYIFNTGKGDLNFGGRVTIADLSGLISKAFALHQ